MHDVPSWVYILFTAVTALGVMIQAMVLLGMLLAMKAAMGRLEQVSKMAEEHVVPMLASSKKTLEEVTPKLKMAAQNVLEASNALRFQSAHVNDTVDELLKKAESQAERVDEMLTGTLNSISHATAAMQRAVISPVRQMGAMFNGLRAGFDVFRRRERESHAAADGDHFV